jgi:hypothetical protein
MKSLSVIVIGVAVVIGLWLVLGGSNSFSVENEVREVEVIKEVQPDWALDEDAVKAAQDVIRRKELEAMEAEMVADIKARQAELDEVRKELGSY